MKYWAYINDDVSQKPYSEDELKQLQGFGPDLLICSETSAVSADPDWRSVKELLPHLIRPKAPNFAKFRPKPPVPTANRPEQPYQQPQQQAPQSEPTMQDTLPIPSILPAGINATPISQFGAGNAMPAQSQPQQAAGQNDLNRELLAQLESLTSKINSLENKIVEQEKELAEAYNKAEDYYNPPTLVSEPQNEKEDDVLEIPFDNDFAASFDAGKTSEEIAKEAEAILSNPTSAEIEEYNTDDQKTELMTFGSDIQNILEDTIRKDLKEEEDKKEKKASDKEEKEEEKPIIAEDLISRTTLSFPVNNNKPEEEKEEKEDIIEETTSSDELNIDDLDALLEQQNQASEENKEEVAEEQPAQQEPAEEEVVEEKPVEETPAEEQPAEASVEQKEEVAEEQPAQEEPAVEEVVEEKPVEEQPIEETPVVEEQQEVVEEKPVEEQPIEETPVVEEKEEVVEEQPVQEEPAVEEVVEEKPVEEQPIEETPVVEEQQEVVEEKPVQEEPAVEEVVEEKPVEEQPIEETPVVEEKQEVVEEQPVQEEPAVEEVVEEKPVEEQPIEETPTKETPTKDPYQINEDLIGQQEVKEEVTEDDLHVVSLGDAEELKIDEAEENKQVQPEDIFTDLSSEGAEELVLEKPEEEKPAEEPLQEMPAEEPVTDMTITDAETEQTDTDNTVEEQPIEETADAKPEEVKEKENKIEEEPLTLGVSISKDETTAAVLDEIAHEKSHDIEPETTPEQLFEELEHTAQQKEFEEDNLNVDKLIEETQNQPMPQVNAEAPVEAPQEESMQEMPKDLPKEDEFLKTFTMSVEEVFLDQPTAIISDYVPPSDNTQRNLQDKLADTSTGLTMETIRREKPSDIKTVPLVSGAMGQEIWSSPYVESATAQLRKKTKFQDTLKFGVIIAGVVLALIILYTFCAMMGLVPEKLSPLHRIVYSLHKSPEEKVIKDEEMAPEVIENNNIAAAPEEPTVAPQPTTPQAPAKAAEPEMTGEQLVIQSIKEYPFKDGTNLEERILKAHPNLNGAIDWSLYPTEEEDVFSIAIKLPANSAGQSFSYRFNYNIITEQLIPTTSSAKSIMGK